MKVLVLNCGSSSVKYQLFDMQDEIVLCSGIVEEIGSPRATMTHRRPGHDELAWRALHIPNHRAAIRAVLSALQDARWGVLSEHNPVDAVGHRVVHGGERFASSVLIDSKVLKAIYENIELAPLHNPPNIQGIEAISALLPNTPQVAIFDTAFHQTMSPEAFLYAIPYPFYRKYGIRRYGFHGTSHQFISRKAAEFLARPLSELRIVTCHLGNGASVAAVQYGRSVDTSMGFTPLEGLPMGTRSGDLDPAIVPFLMDKEALDRVAIDDLLNKRSGVLGLSQLSSDMRTFEQALHAGSGHPHYSMSVLILRLYTRRITKYIGAYAAIMGGLDCVAFTGGVGENFKEVSEWACKGLEFLGIEGVHSQRCDGKIIEATSPDSPTKVLIIPTNEELAIARDTVAIVSENRAS